MAVRRHQNNFESVVKSAGSSVVKVNASCTRHERDGDAGWQSRQIRIEKVAKRKGKLWDGFTTGQKGEVLHQKEVSTNRNCGFVNRNLLNGGILRQFMIKSVVKMTDSSVVVIERGRKGDGNAGWHDR